VLHEPVLITKVLSLLDPKKGETVLDGTLGSGGYSEAILERIGEEGKLMAIDRDPDALLRCQKRFVGRDNIYFCQVNYSSFEKALHSQSIELCDKMVLDLGLSRDQLVDAGRGFSFAMSGPLDMRMDRTEDVLTLEELFATVSEEELANLIYQWGEERFSRRIARAILDAFRKGRIRTTGELAEVVKKAVPYKDSKNHPATRTFQALRIAVNREMEHLELFLKKFPSHLSRGGRLGIVTFHSLEDRIVKNRFRDLSKTGEFRLVNKKVECADREEIMRNPSSRSAKLRVIERN